MFKILVVEDNDMMRDMFSSALEEAGYDVFEASDGEEALEMLDENFVDLIVADVMMPRLNGFELTKMLRESNYELPILMVTSNDGFEEMKKGFRLGVDDYMVKPVNLAELELRVAALLRRAHLSNDKRLSVGDTTLIYDTLTVIQGSDEICLPQKEFYILYKLLSSPGKIFTRYQLMDDIWGMDYDSDERTVNTHINRLRTRFADCKDFEIVTVRGVGYKAVRRA